MEDNNIIDNLIEFGLTRQEAIIYVALHKATSLTGYEVAKITGISRSNVYSSLSGLVDKGASFMLEGDSTKYIAVEVEEFTKNRLRILTLKQDNLIETMPRTQAELDGYITIRGCANIYNKMINMLDGAKLRVYLYMTASRIDDFEEKIKELVKKEIKVILISDKEVTIPGVITYRSEDKGNQIGIITDSVNVLTGEYKHTTDDSALYTGCLLYTSPSPRDRG